MSLGQKIRDLRIAKGLTQTELGAGLVTASMISQIEGDKANPSYPVLESLAKRLETPLEYFLADIKTQMEEKSIYLAGRAFRAMEKYEQALQLFEDLYNRHDLTIDLLALKLDLGECYLHFKRHEPAFVHTKDALTMADQQAEQLAALQALNQLGLIEKDRRKPHAAIFYWRSAYERFDQLLVKDPFIQSQILNNLGIIHQEMGEVSEALNYLQVANSLLQTSTDYLQIGFTYLQLVESCRELREYDKAIEYAQYAQAIFESIRNAQLALDATMKYGIALGEGNRQEKALAVLSKCLRSFNKNEDRVGAAYAHQAMAQLYLKEKKYAAVIKECETALPNTPSDHVVYALLLKTQALAEDASGNVALAIELMERALEGFSGHPTEEAEVYSMLGYLYEKQGDLPASNGYLQQMKHTLSGAIRDRGIIL